MPAIGDDVDGYDPRWCWWWWIESQLFILYRYESSFPLYNSATPPLQLLLLRLLLKLILLLLYPSILLTHLRTISPFQYILILQQHPSHFLLISNRSNRNSPLYTPFNCKSTLRWQQQHRFNRPLDNRRTFNRVIIVRLMTKRNLTPSSQHWTTLMLYNLHPSTPPLGPF